MPKRSPLEEVNEELVSTESMEDSVETPNTKEKNKKTKNIEDVQSTFEAFMLATNKDLIITEQNKLTIPSGIDLLDAVLGGGFGMKFSMVVGPPGGGKSSLIGKVIASGQKKWPNKFIAMYLDSEESMNADRLAQLGCSSIVNPVNEITVEKVFKLVESLCVYKEKNKELLEIPSVIVWDSLANTQTEAVVESDERNNMMGAQRAGALSYYLPKYITKMNHANVSLLTINQIRVELKTDMYDSTPKAMNFLKSGVVPGGMSVIHNSVQALELYQFGPKDYVEKTYGFKGIKVAANAARNKLNTPNIPISLIFNFEKGYSNFWTNVEMLKTHKYIEAGGAWSTLHSCPQPKFYAKNALEVCNSNPEWKAAFLKDVEDCININYVLPYKNVTDKLEIGLD